MTQLANLAPGHRETRPHVLAEAQVRRDANDRARVAFNARAEKAKERTTAEDAKCDDGRDADAARRPRRQRASTSNPNDAGALPGVRETTDDDVAGAAHLAVASTLAAKGRVAEAECVLFNVLRARPNDAGARWLLRQIREPSGAVPGRGPPKTKATPKPPQPEPEVPLEELFARLKGAPEPPGGRRVAELMKRLDREMGERETPMLVGVGPAPRMDLGPVRGRPAAGASVVTLSDLDDELAKKKARLAEERRRDMEFDARVAADERAAIAREDAAAADAKRRATREQKFGLDAQQRVDRERRDQLWAEEKRKGLEATRGGRESSEKTEVGRGSVAVIGGEEMAPRGKKTREPPKRRALAPFAFRR
ncbi:uncharacterized protein MICPUCDRAFT_59796 [Micromonas pusilla CCMP1545]|uniref:Predicted protein n=1 Tax=Micromonas pusilla (strain CCMP1545) TaxID=564608 RepID=C1MWJ9_MICPC|nr:uncharacterized protein MICPUCDRAFT_59796 [Micromonas pusilla CCMP1545]EEH56183.1 predicted protein [Micromonas pusilla CCMP1545]|eukprot:XP_003060231.1 predicted protein [Micromonas pusilla CCMP1545]